MKPEDRIQYAKRALDGIALGDCFGQSFFIPDEAACQRIKNRGILEEPWHFTDDTVMAIGIYRILEKYGTINQDELARVFAKNYTLDWHRGYGGTAHSILRSIGEGQHWQEVALGAFDGMGSMGNGGRSYACTYRGNRGRNGGCGGIGVAFKEKARRLFRRGRSFFAGCGRTVARE